MIICDPPLIMRILLLAALSFAHLCAQTDKGTLSGNVTDPAGAAVPDTFGRVQSQFDPRQIQIAAKFSF